MKKVSKPDPSWLNKTAMAKACGISVQAFAAWGVDPVDKIGGQAYYRVQDVIANRIEHDRKRRKADAPAVDPDRESLDRSEREERLALVREQREGQALKNAQLRRELAPVAVIEFVLQSVAGQIGAILEALPPALKKIAPRLAAREMELITREVVKARNAAAHVTVDIDEYYDRAAPGD